MGGLGEASGQGQEIRLAMLGMVDGNGHPYSWSAIFDGYDPEEMAKCPFAGIPVYLNKETKATLRIPGVRVTHIWTDDPADARHVAKASLIPNVVERPEDVIGQVDAVIVATDKGHEHVARCKPFVDAGLPIFVDKPMVDNALQLCGTAGHAENFVNRHLLRLQVAVADLHRLLTHGPADFLIFRNTGDELPRVMAATMRREPAECIPTMPQIWFDQALRVYAEADGERDWIESLARCIESPGTHLRLCHSDRAGYGMRRLTPLRAPVPMRVKRLGDDLIVVDRETEERTGRIDVMGGAAFVPDRAAPRRGTSGRRRSV